MPAERSVEAENRQPLIEGVLDEDFILRRDEDPHRLVHFPRPLARFAESPQEFAFGVEDLDPAILPVEDIRRPVLKDV
jgi:hypothetical protein